MIIMSEGAQLKNKGQKTQKSHQLIESFSQSREIIYF